MSAILVFLPTLIAMIPSAMGAVQAIIAFVSSIRFAAKQTGEWTPALETQFLDALIARTTSPAWTPDPPTAVNVLNAVDVLKAPGTVTKETTVTTTTV